MQRFRLARVRVVPVQMALDLARDAESVHRRLVHRRRARPVAVRPQHGNMGAPPLGDRPADDWGAALGLLGAEFGLRVEQVDGERVGDQHDEQRDEEGRQRAVDEEVMVEDGARLVVEHVRRVQQTQHDDGAGDGQRDEPHGGDLDADDGARLVAVLERVADGDVAVQGDGAHVHDGGGAHHDVQDLPQVTHDQPERPVACKKTEGQG